MPDENRMNAYNYGKQLVPVSAENEKMLKLDKSGKSSLEKKDGDGSGEANPKPGEY